MFALVKARERFPRNPREHARLRLEQDDAAAQLEQGGGGLEADVAAADYDDISRTLPNVPEQTVDVRPRPDDVGAWKIGVGA